MSRSSGYHPVGLALQPTGYAGGVGRVAPSQRTAPGFLAIMAGLYLSSVPVFSYSVELGMSWLPQVLAATTGLCWIVWGAFLGRKVAWPIPIVLYVAWALWSTSGILVTENSVLFVANLKSVLKVAATTFLVAQCVRTRADLLACFFLVSVGLYVVIYVGIDDVIRAAQSTAATGRGAYRTEETLVGNANALAEVALTVLIGSLTCLFALRGKVWRMLAIPALPASLYTIAATGSRKGMASVLIIGIGFFALQLRRMGRLRQSQKVGIMLFGLFAAGGSVYFISKLPFLERLTATVASSENFESEARYRWFLVGLEQTVEHPIMGLGLQGFAIAGFGKTKHGATYSHSTITETLCATGIPGFLLYFGGLFAMFNLLRKLRKADLPPPDKVTVNMMMILFLIVFMFNVAAVLVNGRLIWPLLGGVCGYLHHLSQSRMHLGRLA